jgi:two-component system, OmpR family, heavy metal sensor histidine kinase CusS
VTIRTRLSLWYAAVMFVALMVMGVLLYFQLVIGPRHWAHRHHRNYREEEAADPDVFEDVTGIVMWCGIPAALLAVAGGWWLMNKSLAPVAGLTRAAETINTKNLNQRLPRTGSDDELDRLTEVFNSMLARLDDSFNRIREFTLHASHELKTPLTVLCGETETALRDEPLSPSERERAASQLDELRRLARIVDGLTLLAKADAGQITLQFESVRLDELARDNFADLQILAEPQHIQVELAACEEITLRGDRHRLRQLLLNLADNAVKYNQPRGRVTMSLRRAGDFAEFKITNTGAGIPSEILPRVFDRFYRGDPAHENIIDGCGLGLSIAQWIVSAHDGTIHIESATSEQTTVTVRLPKA